MNTAALIRGDAIALPLADESVDLIVTSPPYFALRSYTDGGKHYDGQIGSEPTPPSSSTRSAGPAPLRWSPAPSAVSGCRWICRATT